MRKEWMLLAVVALVAACGRDNSSTFTSAGITGTSEQQRLLFCESHDGHYQLEIRSMKASTFSRGLLTAPGLKIEMQCVRVPLSSPRGYDLPVPLWQCDERRNGEGLFHVAVATQGLSSLLFGHVSQSQMFPLAPQKMATMICKE